MAERRIAELVAQGRSNSVAAGLFLTEHSVETALSRIYHKLRIDSRAHSQRLFQTAEVSSFCARAVGASLERKRRLGGHTRRRSAAGPRGCSIMKRRISLAAIVGLAAMMALGPRCRPRPRDNAVVHWSEIAEAAISAPTTAGGPLRPPASSTVLAGMVHGAMYDAVAAVAGGLEPFATCRGTA